MHEQDGEQLTGFFKNVPLGIDEDFTPQIPDSSQFYCDALDDETINSVLNDVKPELIVLIGFSDYGKSTFVGSLYNYLLNIGTVEGYTLYDSDTYSGFERRFYLRNVKNDENTKSKTLRTEEEDGYMLTLNFYNPSNKEKKLLIISDRAGETYKKYVNTKAALIKDTSLPRAQKILLFIDGIAVANDWDAVQEKFRLLFTGLNENNKIPLGATYNIIINKMDLVKKDSKCFEEYNNVKHEVINFFKEQLAFEEAPPLIELDSKHIHDNEPFKKLVECLIRKDDTLKNEETRLKKILDWVSDKIK